MVGCLNFNDPANTYLGKGVTINVIDPENTQTYGYTYYYNQGQQVKISKGAKKNLDLTATYNSNNIPMYKFTKDLIKNISVYLVDRKEDNPLGSNYESYYNYYDPSALCAKFEGTNPKAVIQIN